MRNELERARDKLHGEWKRTDLERALDIGKTKALDLIRNWNGIDVCERVPGTSDRYRWCGAAPTASAAPESLSGNTQTPIQERPRARATRTQPVPAAVWLGATASALSALAMVLLLVILSRTSTAPLAVQPTIAPTAVPTQLPTATLTAPVIPAWWSPGGDPAPGVDPATIRDYTGRYGDYVQVNGNVWVALQHADGVDLASLPDLRPPDAPPTARVVVEQVPVYVEGPAQRPAQTQAPVPPDEYRGGGGGGLAPAPAILSGDPAPGVDPEDYWVSGYDEYMEYVADN